MSEAIYCESLTTGQQTYWPYKRLIAAMVGHAVIDVAKSEKDWKWINQSELAELYCEVIGRDIEKMRKLAIKVRESKRSLQRLEKAAIPYRYNGQNARKYPDEIKEQALDLHEDGFSNKQIVIKLGIKNPSTVSTWIRQAKDA